MRISDFDYDLPQELIAQEPELKREASRMLALDRGSGDFSDLGFQDLPSLLRKDDVVVLNNTKVFPARLTGVSDTGASIEIFLVEERAEYLWEALAKPLKRLRPGKSVSFSEALTGTITDITGSGRVVISFTCDGDLNELVDEIGHTPLPPYIKRENNEHVTDRERYQTVYASERGAIAAPTAGLHFTRELLGEIEAAGAELAEITLHVGYGTFAPVRAEDTSGHTVLPEKYWISGHAAETVNRALMRGNRIMAIGTTTTRALEDNFAKFGRISEGSRSANLTITPGYSFRCVGGLLTNFHLPRSSLLILVSTFAGHSNIMKAYAHAVNERYRFYSYGDCMFIS